MQPPPKVLTPLGIIFLFVALAEAVLGIGITQTTGWVQGLLAVFACFFPTGVASAFFFILYHRPENFYAPRDFTGDDSYLESMNQARSNRIQLFSNVAEKLQSKIEEEVRLVAMRASGTNLEKREESTEKEVRRVSAEILNFAFLTIDLSTFDSSLSKITLPAEAYATLNDLTDELYFILSAHVRPFSYGYDWIIRHKGSNNVIQSRRMLDRIPVGQPAPDHRSLIEVGVKPGSELEVIKPGKIKG